VIIYDTWLDKRWQPETGYTWIRSYAGSPIQVKGKVVGFLNLDGETPGFFSPDVASRLRAFSDQAGVAIENARLYNLASRRAEEMGMLYRIGLSITANIKMDQVLAALFEQCRSALPIDVFFVLLFDSST